MLSNYVFSKKLRSETKFDKLPNFTISQQLNINYFYKVQSEGFVVIFCQISSSKRHHDSMPFLSTRMFHAFLHGEVQKSNFSL